jgi:hypothetical protein
MIRILLFLIIIALGVIAIRFPQFRRAIGITLIIILLTVGGIIWQDSKVRRSEFHRISADQTRLSHMAVRPGLNSRSFVINGRLQNRDLDHSILSIRLRVTLEDCHDSLCEIIGQEEADLPLEVPPDQSRDFRLTIPFSSVPVLTGESNWKFEILSIRAR